MSMTIQDAKRILEAHGLTVDQTDTATLIVRNAYRDRNGVWQDEALTVTADGRIFGNDFNGTLKQYLGY